MRSAAPSVGDEEEPANSVFIGPSTAHSRVRVASPPPRIIDVPSNRRSDSVAIDIDSRWFVSHKKSYVSRCRASSTCGDAEREDSYAKIKREQQPEIAIISNAR